MTRGLAFLLIGAMLAGGGLSAASARKGPARYFPDPSSVFAADIAFGRSAREKGVMAAFRQHSVDEAEVLMPRPVSVRDLVKSGTPIEALRRSARRAYVSCDGRTAATLGTWRADEDRRGNYITIWRRDKKGEWAWVIGDWARAGGQVAAPAAGPDIVVEGDDGYLLQGRVASCRNVPGARQSLPSPDGVKPDKQAPPPDQSLLYERLPEDVPLQLRMWNGTSYEVIPDDQMREPS